MKILLTHSYFYKLDPKQWKSKQPYPPLGTLQAASVLRRHSFPLHFFDASFCDHPSEISNSIKETQPDCLIIYDDGFNYLTKMCLSVMRQAAFTLIEEGKKYGCSVIVCSSDAADHYEEDPKCGADYVIRGEGENTLVELTECLRQGREPGPLAGMAYRNGTQTDVTETRPVMRDLDQFPMAAWDLVDIDAYRRTWMKHHGYFSLNIATTRGCPYKCNWCAKPIYGNRYNSRSPEHVVNEIEFLLREYRPDHFWMSDDIFGLKPGWIEQFSTLVLSKNLKFRFKIQSRVDLLLKHNTIDHLAAAGVDTVWVGAESGSQKILDAMEKGTTVEQIDRATQGLQQKGVKVGFFLQFGYLGETRDDIDKTLNMVLKLMPDDIGISVSYPLPGTSFHERVKSDLKEKRNWTDSDDLAMMYPGTFTPAYYKILHRYVHSRYRIQRGIKQLKAFHFHRLRAIASMVYHAPLSVVNSYRLKQLRHAVN